MQKSSFLIFFVLISCIGSQCKQSSRSSVEDDTRNKDITLTTGQEVSIVPDDPDPIPEDWKEITTENSGILLDIRYASKNNFTKVQIYPCGKCFLRPDLADKLINLNKYINDRYKLTLKVYDCYRPRPAQQKLWDIVPNPIYVSPPEKGSMHNRGMAVDLTLVDELNNELNMGTDYDFFGRAAHTDYLGHSEEINKNRAMLAELMASIGFRPIQSEWWHFSSTTTVQPLSDWEWPCE